MNYLSMQILDKIHELYEYNLPINTIHKIHEISGPDKNSDNSWILWIEVALKKNSWNSWISWKISGGNSWVSGGNSWVSGGNARQLFLALDLYIVYICLVVFTWFLGSSVARAWWMGNHWFHLKSLMATWPKRHCFRNSKCWRTGIYQQ